MMTVKIGIIGYGMVGKTIHAGFNDVDAIIVDPEYSTLTIPDLCAIPGLEAIFVCVPTPEDDPAFSILTTTLDTIQRTEFGGLVVVKSTVLPHFISSYDVIYNPEFLSRSSALEDFLHPPYVVVSGDRAPELVAIYAAYTDMDLSHVYIVDMQTAAFIKYTANTFYALKVTYMNEMHAVAKQMGADYTNAVAILNTNPLFGSGHAQVPGPDGEYGFGGPCLPKDTKAITRHYGVELLEKTLELNARFRK